MPAPCGCSCSAGLASPSCQRGQRAVFVLSVPRTEQPVLSKHQGAQATDHLQVSDAGWFSCNLLGWPGPGARVCSREVTLTALHLSIHGFPLLSRLFHTTVIIRLCSLPCCRHVRYVVAIFWRKLFIRIVFQKQKLRGQPI